jgi:hypothetical protein
MIERIKVFEQQLKDQEIEIENRERQQMAILEKSDVNASLMFLFFFLPESLSGVRVHSGGALLLFPHRCSLVPGWVSFFFTFANMPYGKVFWLTFLVLFSALPANNYY